MQNPFLKAAEAGECELIVSMGSWFGTKGLDALDDNGNSVLGLLLDKAPGSEHLLEVMQLLKQVGVNLDREEPILRENKDEKGHPVFKLTQMKEGAANFLLENIGKKRVYELDEKYDLLGRAVASYRETLTDRYLKMGVEVKKRRVPILQKCIGSRHTQLLLDYGADPYEIYNDRPVFSYLNRNNALPPSLRDELKKRGMIGTYIKWCITDKRFNEATEEIESLDGFDLKMLTDNKENLSAALLKAGRHKDAVDFMMKLQKKGYTSDKELEYKSWMQSNLDQKMTDKTKEKVKTYLHEHFKGLNWFSCDEKRGWLLADIAWVYKVNLTIFNKSWNEWVRDNVLNDWEAWKPWEPRSRNGEKAISPILAYSNEFFKEDGLLVYRLATEIEGCSFPEICLRALKEERIGMDEMSLMLQNILSGKEKWKKFNPQTLENMSEVLRFLLKKIPDETAIPILSKISKDFFDFNDQLAAIVEEKIFEGDSPKASGRKPVRKL